MHFCDSAYKLGRGKYFAAITSKDFLESSIFARSSIFVHVFLLCFCPVLYYFFVSCVIFLLNVSLFACFGEATITIAESPLLIATQVETSFPTLPVWASDSPQKDAAYFNRMRQEYKEYIKGNTSC